MKLVAPNYYEQFQCIADKCKHSCCIGWEIDVDQDTLEYYDTIEGSFGKRLQENIIRDDQDAHFCLGNDERCPFLNEKGLCDIIIQLGEDALCQICDDHPRYRSFYSDREEIGVGISCEAAAQLIITHNEKTQLVELYDDEEILLEEENEFLALRQRIWNMLQDRTTDFNTRVENVYAYCGIAKDEKTPQQWAQIYRQLERLDPVWDKVLDALENAEKHSISFVDEWLQTAFEQLAVYFTYRHLADSLDDGRFVARLQFALNSVKMIMWVASVHCDRYGKIDAEILAEIARIYSAEIEYSTENIDALLEVFES